MSMLELAFKFPPFAKKVRSQKSRIMLFMAAMIQTNRGMLFDEEGAYNGHTKWKPLLFRNGMPLSDRGQLRKSISPSNPKGMPGPDGVVQFSGDTLKVGTKLMYAALMNDGTVNMPGGVLRAKNAKALKIPLPAGKKATDLSKSLRKKDKSGKRTAARIAEIRDDIETTLNPSRRAKLRERLQEIEEANKGFKKNDRFLFVKSVRIPARNFTDWNEIDQNELDEATWNLIQEIMLK